MSLTVACVTMLSSTTPLAAQRPTFSSRLEAVRVDVLVTDRGKVITGLTPSDFEVRDNGVLQTVDLVSFQQMPLNVILAFDVSASVSGERLQHLRTAGRTLLDRLTKEDRASLLTFSHAVALREGMTGDLERVRTALDDVQPAGDTALVDGSYAAMMMDPADGGRSLLIVFSDGLDTSSWLSPERVLDSAKRSGVVVYGVATGESDESRFLEDIGDLTGGAVVKIESTKDLSTTFLRILDEFRQRYLVSYSPSGVAKDGWHQLDVRVKGRRASVKARPGYQAGS
jgi:VWFA-related protein